MKKLVSLLTASAVAASAVGVAGFSGVIPAVTSGAARLAPVTLTVGGWPAKTDPTYAQYEQWKTEFQKAYPNVTIVESPLNYWSGGGGTGSAFYTAAAAGQLPNLTDAPFTETNRVISNGYAADISSELKSVGWLKFLNPVAAKSVMSNGKYYGIPTGLSPMGLWINVALFKKAGLVDKHGLPIAPQTYAQVAKDAAIIHQKTGLPGFLMPSEQNMGGWYFLMLAYSFGEQFEKQVNGKWMATFNDKPAVQALTWLQDLKWKSNAVQPQALFTFGTLLQDFGTNQGGMTFGSPDWTNILINSYKASKDNYAVQLMPQGPTGKRVGEVGGTWYFFSANSTPAQITAGIHWMEFTGTSPYANKTSLDGFTQGTQSNVKLGYPVGPHDPSEWNNSAPMVAQENAITKKYTNVNMALYNNWQNNALKYMKAEPPIDTQQMYAALDNAVQAVLSNKNANPQSILNTAVQNFQHDYLNNTK